jgi:hypothetical protein
MELMRMGTGYAGSSGVVNGQHEVTCLIVIKNLKVRSRKCAPNCEEGFLILVDPEHI